MTDSTAGSVDLKTRSNFFTATRGALITALLICIYLAVRHYFTDPSWIGRDTDDAMRMVEVRDLLAGQGWFDHFQYRLGLDGGTSMHWSRIVDAPIAALVLFFHLFMPIGQAEVAGVFVWPLLTVFPLVLAMSVASERFGGREALLPAYIMTAFFIMMFPRFGPGSIDHHNVQLALAAIVAAGILDRGLGARSFAVAGIAGAFAIAVGVETLPIIAICCAGVALLWAHEGEHARRAAAAFCAGFSITLLILYFTNIGPAEYTKVYCDAFSYGFLVIGIAGSGALWLAVVSMNGKGRLARYSALIAIAALCAIAAKLVAPECLESPYATLDPLLKTLWLDHVTEAQSFFSMVLSEPFKIPTFFATPVAAMLACAWFAWKGPRTSELFTVSLLVVASFAVSLYQVRGATFALMLATIPLSLMVAKARAAIHRPGAVLRDHLLFVFACLVSLPFCWAFLGLGLDRLTNAEHGKDQGKFSACTSQAELAQLAAQPEGLVASVSNIGAHMLLFTDQRALTAPYHRNQAGMLAGLRISTLPPAEAGAEARKDGVTIIAVCPENSETHFLADRSPDGLLSQLIKGNVPDFLEPVPGTQQSKLQLYRVKPVS